VDYLISALQKYIQNRSVPTTNFAAFGAILIFISIFAYNYSIIDSTISLSILCLHFLKKQLLKKMLHSKLVYFRITLKNVRGIIMIIMKLVSSLKDLANAL